MRDLDSATGRRRGLPRTLAMITFLAVVACVPVRRPVKQPFVSGPPRLTVGDWVRVRQLADTTRSVRGRIEASDLDTLQLRMLDPASADTSGLRVVPRGSGAVAVKVPWAEVRAVTIPLGVALERHIPSPEIQVREETSDSRGHAGGAALVAAGCVIGALVGGFSMRQTIVAGIVAGIGCPLLARAIVSRPVEVGSERGTTEPDELGRWVLVPDARAQLITSAARAP